jgi:hypothetical protein
MHSISTNTLNDTDFEVLVRAIIDDHYKTTLDDYNRKHHDQELLEMVVDALEGRGYELSTQDEDSGRVEAVAFPYDYKLHNPDT